MDNRQRILSVVMALFVTQLTAGGLERHRSVSESLLDRLPQITGWLAVACLVILGFAYARRWIEKDQLTRWGTAITVIMFGSYLLAAAF
jgi:hypothetical protein